MEDLILITVVIVFFILCFGMIKFFDLLSRGEE
jgi:hypothetical protein